MVTVSDLGEENGLPNGDLLAKEGEADVSYALACGGVKMGEPKVVYLTA